MCVGTNGARSSTTGVACCRRVPPVATLIRDSCKDIREKVIETPSRCMLSWFSYLSFGDVVLIVRDVEGVLVVILWRRWRAFLLDNTYDSCNENLGTVCTAAHSLYAREGFANQIYAS